VLTALPDYFAPPNSPFERAPIKGWPARAHFHDREIAVMCWAARKPPRGSIKAMILEGWIPLRREKMLERLAWILLASVLAFGFAPYFYALGGA